MAYSADAILADRAFRITEDFVDLLSLERHILKALPFPLYFGAEWFEVGEDGVELVAELIDQLLCEAGLSYV